MKQTLQLKVSTQLALTPQLQQSIKLLQMSTIELQEEIERILQENPMLDREEGEETALVGSPESSMDGREEFSAPDSTEQASENESERSSSEDFDGSSSDWMTELNGSGGSYSDSDEERSYESYVAAAESLTNYLNKQLSLTPVSDRDRSLIQVLIESLDEDGYLAQPLEEILEIFPFDWDVRCEELKAALALLQHFDPPGVGARSAAECLRLQLQFSGNNEIQEKALEVVNHYLDWLANRDYVRLKKTLKCDEASLRAVLDLILSLNPRPGAAFSTASTRYIIPDVIVKKVKGQWVVQLNEEAIPKLKINRLYASLLSNGSIGKKDSENLNGQLQEARWFIRNVHQRFETILKVSTTIVERQSDFLEHGEISMRPLVLKEIAQILDLHESTISRVTNQKYIQTPRGIYELKYFFGSHCSTETGGACSSTAIKALIRQFIQQENPKKPLSDNKVAQLLGEQGIVVARRTVAKYRELMQIPAVNQRKTI